MLITLDEASKRFATSKRDILRARTRRQLTEHQSHGVMLFDDVELTALFAPRTDHALVPPADDAPRPPAVERRVVPTPDELDAAVKRVLR